MSTDPLGGNQQPEDSDLLTSEEFMALHRHWMWANIIKKHFEGAIADASKSGKANPEDLFPEAYGAYMSIWYGMLYGVLVVPSEKNICLPNIQADIDSIRDSLRLYRNAVFHPQPQYWSAKLIEVMKDPESTRRIWAVHTGLGGFFLEELGRLNSGHPGVYVRRNAT